MVCEKCPMVAVLDAAEKLASTTNHKDFQRAIGGITLTRKSLEIIYGGLGCEGPAINQNNQKDCPLRESVYGARSMGTGPWQENQFIVPLEDLTEHKTSDINKPGQYL